jgi:hypothetical protein
LCLGGIILTRLIFSYLEEFSVTGFLARVLYVALLPPPSLGITAGGKKKDGYRYHHTIKGMRNAWRELVKAAVPKIAYKQWAEYVRAIARARDRVT